MKNVGKTPGNAGNEPLEIERKFLIAMPEEAVLERESAGRIAITQIYLCRGRSGENRRIRRSFADGREVFYYTEKCRLTDRTRIEREREITREEWDRLLPEADSDRRPIEKTRWKVPYAGHVLEIDIFPFWQDRAFCEAELGSEDEELRLPPWLRVIREVTEDIRYTNSALALEIPWEPIA